MVVRSLLEQRVVFRCMLLKEQKKMQQQLLAALREKPSTIPELAAATGLPSAKALWFVSALKKYGIVVDEL